MRHPTIGISEDDLSRLTGSSSSSASAGSISSSSSSSTAANTPAHKEGVDECALTLRQHQECPDKDINICSTTTNTKTTNTSSASEARYTNNNKNSHTPSTRFSSTYLPEFINPLEWQKSRKRKERLDSTSSSTQDRKLQRSNSEELLPPQSPAPAGVVGAPGPGAADAGGNDPEAANAADVIRRVSSEDFKKTGSYAASQQELKELDKDRDQKKAANENDGSLANRQESQQNDPLPPVYRETWISGPIKDMTRRTRYETSPMRSQRLSPIRANGNANGAGTSGRHSDSNDSECEHERRRSSERFCKTRAPPGRKASGVAKKSAGAGGNSSKYLPARINDENAYKYDLYAIKYERRGFISKKAAAASAAEKSSVTASDHNDNNLIDFHQKQQQQQQQQQEQQKRQETSSTTVSATPLVDDSEEASKTPTSTPPLSATATITNTSTSILKSAAAAAAASAAASAAEAAKRVGKIPITSAQEALPWDRVESEDQAPVLSRRYAAVRHHPADNLDTVAKLSKVMPYPQHFHKQTAAQLLADDMDCLEPVNVFRAFTSLENLRTRDVMQQVIPAMMSFQSPEERLKQVNKRLTAMKKKLAQLEEAYEVRMGYRPSQAERLNDKYMKNILAELSKLRKERHELKSDPMKALGLKVSGGMDAAKKLEKMKETLAEIEQNLVDKREDTNRSEALDELTPDQLVQEKTAVQHGLLYFESHYGRPTTKDERDAVRPLYDRYRQLKRMVSRSVLLSGSAAAGAPELPTILEHEAMVFEFTPQQYSSNNSTDTTNSPSDSVAPTASSDDSATTSTTTTTAAVAQADSATSASAASASAASSDANENINTLSIDQLWELLDKTREEKKLLKRSIREYETVFEEQTGRKMLKNDRKTIEETYAQYKEKKAKTRLLQALISKHISR